MSELPKPKRYICERLLYSERPLQVVFYIFADPEIYEFLRLLAPIYRVEPFGPQARIEIDVRYASTSVEAEKTYNWIVEQLRGEFANTSCPAKPQDLN